MRWRLKAAIQNAVSLLPSSASYAAYYWIQRHFGGLRRTDPVKRLAAGIETWRRIRQIGRDPVGRVFFEIGTGRAPIVPIAYWLMGAKKTITIDLNPYMKTELVEESLRYLSSHRDEIQGLFGSCLDENRLDDLLELARRAPFSTRAVLDQCHIHYIAPGDAAKTGLKDRSIDFHTSYMVFEHIRPEVLKGILEEGNRIADSNGLFVHRIDYSDHFSHSDSTISAVNFLQFSDAEWQRYAGNRYMYMNRLRHDDLLDLLQAAGHRILATDPDVDQRSLELLRSGRVPLNERFRRKSEEVLSITGCWIVSQKRG